MKIASIDIETTGLDKELDQILSIGIVLEDTLDIKPIEKLPGLHIIIPRERISGNPFALSMNKDLIGQIKNFNSLSRDEKTDYFNSHVPRDIEYVYESMVPLKINDFLLSNGYECEDGQIHLNVLGKNFSTFDKPFLENIRNWSSYLKIRQRILDPAILNVNWSEDSSLPNLKTCMERCNFNEDREVTHDALQDAKDTLEVLRNSTNFYGVGI